MQAGRLSVSDAQWRRRGRSPTAASPFRFPAHHPKRALQRTDSHAQWGHHLHCRGDSRSRIVLGRRQRHSWGSGTYTSEITAISDTELEWAGCYGCLLDVSSLTVRFCDYDAATNDADGMPALQKLCAISVLLAAAAQPAAARPAAPAAAAALAAAAQPTAYRRRRPRRRRRRPRRRRRRSAEPARPPPSLPPRGPDPRVAVARRRRRRRRRRPCPRRRRPRPCPRRRPRRRRRRRRRASASRRAAAALAATARATALPAAALAPPPPPPPSPPSPPLPPDPPSPMPSPPPPGASLRRRRLALAAAAAALPAAAAVADAAPAARPAAAAVSAAPAAAPAAAARAPPIRPPPPRRRRASRCTGRPCATPRATRFRSPRRACSPMKEDAGGQLCATFYAAGCPLYRDLFLDLTSLGAPPTPPPPPMRPLDELPVRVPARIFSRAGSRPTWSRSTRARSAASARWRSRPRRTGAEGSSRKTKTTRPRSSTAATTRR